MLPVLIVLATVAAPRPLGAAPAEMCDRAAHQAAAETGVPISVLWSITRTETGRTKNGRLRPWPWTVNMEGKGHWFDDEATARAFVQRSFARGARSFDVGCFQINYKWHGASFRSIDQMFDPLENARYAAAFLLRLFHETGDWSRAAGAYHSRTPEYATRYRARFDRIRRAHAGAGEIPAGPGPSGTELASATGTVRQNTYPLLVAGDAPRSHGSLVPLQSGGRGGLFSLSSTFGGS